MKADFSAGLRLAAAVVVPSAVILAVLGPPLAEALLAHGATSLASARYMGQVFAVFCLGLLPYTVFQLQLRVFYALQDSRTPAFIGAACMVLNVAVNYVALAVLPPGRVVAGLGAGFGAANLLGAAMAWRILSRRLGGLGGRAFRRCLLRMHAAALPAAAVALILSLTVRTAVPKDVLGALVTVVLAGGGATTLYLVLARFFRVSELTQLLAMITSLARR